MNVEIRVTNAKGHDYVEDDINFLLDMLGSEIDQDNNLLDFNLGERTMTAKEVDRIYDTAGELLNAKLKVFEEEDNQRVKRLIQEIGSAYRNRYDLAQGDEAAKALGAMLALNKLLKMLDE